MLGAMTCSVLTLCGSLRKASLNRVLLDRAQELTPKGATFQTLDYRSLPAYDSDLDTAEPPAGVADFRTAVQSASAVLVASPEYNYSVPGALKNALDWASRPAYRSPFAGKPVALLSVSIGGTGGSRGQSHLKHVMLGMVSQVFPWPELCVPSTAFHEAKLTDPAIEQRLLAFMTAFVPWAERAATNAPQR